MFVYGMVHAILKYNHIVKMGKAFNDYDIYFELSDIHKNTCYFVLPMISQFKCVDFF